MEPTPELKNLAEAIAQLLVDRACAHEIHLPSLEQILVDYAKELRAVLEPFERAAEFSPAVKAAVSHAQTLREAQRAADEATLNNTLAGKPMPVFREPSLWTRIKRPLLGALADGLAGVLVYVVIVDVLDGPRALGWVFAAAAGLASGFLRRVL